MAHRGVKRKAPTEEDNNEHDNETTSQGSSSEQDNGTSSEYDSDLSRILDQEDVPEDNENIDVDFLFFYPKDIDFHGLKALLRTYLDGEEFTGCSELVETIIQQVNGPLSTFIGIQ